MSVKFLMNEGILTASIYGDIDHHNARVLRESIDKEVENNNPEILKIDFKNLEFMDSSGIGLIMGRYKLMNSLGGKLNVINVPSYMLRVIKISGLEQLGVLEKDGVKNRRF